jgi:hypothetical protein
LISVIALHFLAGSVAGSIFAVRTLLTLVALVLVECAGMTVALGLAVGGWLLASLVALQIGYLAGIYIRSVLERAGFAVSGAQPRHRS